MSRVPVPIVWSRRSRTDIQRLYRFLLPNSPRAAQRAVAAIRQSVVKLSAFPNAGRPVAELGGDRRELLVPFGDGGYTLIYFFNGLDLASLRHRRTEGRVLQADNEEDISRLAERAADRYRSLYIALAAEVQEFKVWSDLAEYATMRSALARMEKLLTVTDGERGQRDLPATIRAVNEAELPRPVIDVQAEGYDVSVVFPSVEEIFLAPHFRITSAGPGKVLSDERWW